MIVDYFDLQQRLETSENKLDRLFTLAPTLEPTPAHSLAIASMHVESV